MLFYRQVHDTVDIQIRSNRPLAAADEIALVRLTAEEAGVVLLRIDGDRPKAEVVAGSNDPYGDLAAVGDHHFRNGVFQVITS